MGRGLTLRRDALVMGFALLALAGGCGAAMAAQVSVAVAANFTGAARALAAAFKSETGNELALSFGATGGLYAQITQGAPFEVFLSADAKTPARAVANGFAVAGTKFTYAVGKIVLYSSRPGLVSGPAVLKAGSFNKLAIANPVTAPYGAAAVAVLKKLGIYAKVQPKLVVGQNIAQTFQFVASGNADLGFVALSEVAGNEGGSRWVVPTGDYPKIAQDAVLLAPGRDSAAAKAFLKFLRGPAALKIIKGFGYGTGAS